MKSTSFLVAAGTLLIIIQSVVYMIDPIFLKIIVDSVEKSYPLWFSMGLVIFIVIMTIIRFLLSARSDFYSLSAYLNVYTILINIIYAKAIKLGSASKVKYSGGTVMNMFSTDTERIRYFWFTLPDYISTPYMVSSVFLKQNYVQTLREKS